MGYIEAFKEYCESCKKQFILVDNDSYFDRLDAFTYWKKLPYTFSPEKTDDVIIGEVSTKFFHMYFNPATFYDAFAINSSNRMMGRINTKRLDNVNTRQISVF